MLIEKFQQYIAKEELFTHEDKILLTVSGGVDSMVLMSLCVNCGYHVGIAHCNFQLRGAESDEDEILVQEAARRYGIECHNKRFDTTGEMELTGESMEMAARRLRYEWFNSLCEKYGYTVIAIAHHVDDSIETFFINMLRGTGLRGLTGINNQVGRVVRPLLFATRKQILEYAIRKHIHFREDSSNRSTKYLRNKIRLGLIPRIKEIAPHFTPTMESNIQRLTQAQRFIDYAMEGIYKQIVEVAGDIITLHTNRIEHIETKDFIIYEILSSHFAFRGDTVNRLCQALKAATSGKRFYSRSHVAYTDRGKIVISPIEPDDVCEVEIQQGQRRAYFSNYVLHFELCNIDDIASLQQPENVALLDAEKLSFPLTLRRWQEGDQFVPFGMTGRKKVSDYLIDSKVSMAEKSRQFVLLSGGEIVWLVGRRISDTARLTRHSEQVLKITKENL